MQACACGRAISRFDPGLCFNLFSILSLVSLAPVGNKSFLHPPATPRLTSSFDFAPDTHDLLSDPLVQPPLPTLSPNSQQFHDQRSLHRHLSFIQTSFLFLIYSISRAWFVPDMTHTSPTTFAVWSVLSFSVCAFQQSSFCRLTDVLDPRRRVFHTSDNSGADDL